MPHPFSTDESDRDDGRPVAHRAHLPEALLALLTPPMRRWLELITWKPEQQARLFERFPRLYQRPALHDFSPPAGWFELL